MKNCLANKQSKRKEYTMKIKIISDDGLVYNPNSVMDAEELINDYREILDPRINDDAEQLQWFNSVSTESQLRYIGAMWDIEYEIEC